MIVDGRLPTPKYARHELERRWQLDHPPPGWSPSDPHKQIEDRYLIGTRLRLRKMDDAYKLGLKEPVEGCPATYRWMTNLYLNEAEYQALLQVPAHVLRKKRYPLRDDCALDLFEDGLMLVEREFPDEESMNAYVLPFPGREVTESVDGGRLASTRSQTEGS